MSVQVVIQGAASQMGSEARPVRDGLAVARGQMYVGGRFIVWFFLERDAEDVEDALEVVVAVESDGEFAADFVGLELDGGAEIFAEALFEAVPIGVGMGGGLGFFGFWASGAGVIGRAGETFDFADTEAIFDDAFEEGGLANGGFDHEEGAGVAFGDFFAQDATLDPFGEFEEAEGVGDRGAGFADSLGNGFLAEVELFDESLVSDGAFHGGDVLALDVFDNSDFERCLTGGGADDDGDGFEPGDFGGAEASLSGDEFKLVIAEGADDEGLEDAKFADGDGEFFELFLVELGSRLARVGADGRYGKFVGGFFGLFTEELGESFSECASHVGFGLTVSV